MTWLSQPGGPPSPSAPLAPSKRSHSATPSWSAPAHIIMCALTLPRTLRRLLPRRFWLLGGALYVAQDAVFVVEDPEDAGPLWLDLVHAPPPPLHLHLHLSCTRIH